LRTTVENRVPAEVFLWCHTKYIFSTGKIVYKVTNAQKLPSRLRLGPDSSVALHTGAIQMLNLLSYCVCFNFTFAYVDLHFKSTRAIPKVSGLDVLDNNIFYNLYFRETHILYELKRVDCGYDVVVIYDVI